MLHRIEFQDIEQRRIKVLHLHQGRGRHPSLDEFPGDEEMKRQLHVIAGRQAHKSQMHKSQMNMGEPFVSLAP
jgi:hypothetical protein